MGVSQFASLGFHLPQLCHVTILHQEVAQLGRVKHFQADATGGGDKFRLVGITAGGASFQTFDIEIDNQGDGGTNVLVHFKINGAPCYDATTGLQIEHVIPIASSTEMHLGAGVKNGAANLETLVIDYIGACQKL